MPVIDLLDIVGQPRAIAQLSRALAGDRRPHAFIFAGPEGVGRRTTAEALAKTLLCGSPRSSTNAGRVSLLDDSFELRQACGQCPSCRAFEAGTHADYQLVHKELARYSADPRVRTRVMQDLGIDVVREFLIEPSNRRSASGRGKVFVIREADLMSVAAQNAMLKTLEEPPPGVTIILLCETPAALLPTTRSRCALVRFAPLDVPFVTERLIAGATDADEAHFLAAYTDGSLGRSQRSAGGALFAFKRKLVDRLSGLVDEVDAELGEWLADQAKRFADEMLSADKQLAGTLATRRASGLVLGMIASVYRDAMTLAAGRAELIHADQAAAIERIAEAKGVEMAAEIVEQLARFEELLWRNVNPKAVWDNVVISCVTGAPLDV
jgi:DNA polymerase-3 subunit delta'